jgi:hypothetical protein
VLKKRVKGYFVSPYFLLPSFVLILGLVVPNPNVNELFGILGVIFLISYLITVIVMLCYPEPTPEEPAPKRTEIPVFVAKVADLPKVRYIYPTDDGNAQMK